MGTSRFVSLVEGLGALRGVRLAAPMRVFEFGCGDGAQVYEWLDAGYDAYGFDIHDRVRLRHPEDARRFATGGATTDDPSVTAIEAATFRLPFEDEAFDLVVSRTVLEHVADVEPVIRELARVTRRPGLGLHTFPATYGLVEQHVGVPLASFFRPRWWLRLWAELGVRNEFQRGLRASHVAELNARYLATGAFYRTPASWLRRCAPHFDRAAFDPTSWRRSALAVDGRSETRLHATLSLAPAVWLFNHVRHCVLVTHRD